MWLVAFKRPFFLIALEKMLRSIAAAATAALAASQVPTWPQTWQLNKSTILMTCNYSGYVDPSTTVGWAIVDFDCELLTRSMISAMGLGPREGTRRSYGGRHARVRPRRSQH